MLRQSPASNKNLRFLDKTLNLKVSFSHDLGRRQQGSGEGCAPPPWIFIHDTDKVEGGLMVLFFGLVFFRCPLPWKIFCRRLWT